METLNKWHYDADPKVVVWVFINDEVDTSVSDTDKLIESMAIHDNRQAEAMSDLLMLIENHNRDCWMNPQWHEYNYPLGDDRRKENPKHVRTRERVNVGFDLVFILPARVPQSDDPSKWVYVNYVVDTGMKTVFDESFLDVIGDFEDKASQSSIHPISKLRARFIWDFKGSMLRDKFREDGPSMYWEEEDQDMMKVQEFNRD